MGLGHASPCTVRLAGEGGHVPGPERRGAVSAPRGPRTPGSRRHLAVRHTPRLSSWACTLARPSATLPKISPPTTSNAWAIRSSRATTAVQRARSTSWRCGRRLLVFCEVKARRDDRFGAPAEAVDRTKQMRLKRLAARWLADHRPGAVDIRFDVVSVIVRDGRCELTHIPDAF